ncbi:MAG: protein kinase, partial [Lachnospiraceae bacterium]|nr:protein kinase [Lachnospiraceae bacterium]
MNIHREFWEKGTHILLSSGNRYEISGLPIGTGGGSIIYPAYRLVLQTNGTYKYDGIHYALKECFPHSHEYEFSRNSSGTVIPLEDSKEAWDYLNHVKQMQLHEKDITQKIYQTGSRLLPIRESAEHFFVEKANLKTEAELIQVDNCITVMDSLASKGRSLESYIQEYEKFTVLQTFEIIHQVLLAVKEIHQSEFLHLDIQSGNIYIKGSLENENDIVTMIDFGSARHLINGKTEPITDRVIFTTEGFSAPEILSQNNGFLQLGPEADIYSIGVLILYMLTGTRYDSATLLNNQTGKYLSRFKLRKIDCPKHLIDGMQDIIAHALAANPENRYHSADEMLKDVAILIKELQPICGHLDFILYDAFICYRHSTLDSKAAKAIQERLEHFRVPKGFSEQRHPFRRVFLDEGELSSCADFGKMIDTALKNSSWLIVICSPDTPFSNWVNVEIETFLKYHDRSKILTVLVEGTPDTSFPDILKGDSDRNNGVFAADVRGTTESRILKKIRGDSLLRITAPMLGTTYDALKQRHKVYKRKRTFTLAGVLGLFLVAFSIYAFKQNFLLEKERSNANANQLQYTIESAKNQLSTNRPKAIKTLLDGFGDDKNTESLGAEAECTLTKAVNAYSTPYSEQSPVLSTTFETPATDEFELTEIYSDPEHNVLIGYDLCHIYFWDTESGSLLKELSVTEFHDSQLKCREDWIYPEKNLLFFYTDSGKFYCYDYLHNIVKWSFSSKKYSIYDPSAAICKSSNTFILIFDSQVIEVDISNGNIVSEISTAQEYPYIHLMNNFTISETCNTLAIYAGTFDSAQEDEIIKYGRYCTKKEDNIILYNLKTHSCEMIPLETYDIGSADTDLIITNRQLLIGIVPSKTDEVSSSRHNEITLISVNLKNNEIFWKSTIDFSHSIVNKEDSLNKDYFCSVNLYLKETTNGSTVLLSSYENCVRINVKDGAVEKQWKFSDSITSILINEYGYYAITKDGVVYNTRWYKDEGDIFTDFQEDPNLCIFDGESIIIHFYDSPLKMYTLAYDPSYKRIVNASVSDTYGYYIANCYSDENYFVTINVRELLLDGRSHSGEGYQIEWYEIEKQQNKKVHQLK